jgi:predicted phage baseplate assembly protein
MPIHPPALDDRGFQDLLAEMLRRIPAHTPEWTNPQEGDPGRAILDVMAWLADTILYRANLIPERQRLAFLKLLGVGLRPARPAYGLLSLALQKPADVKEVFCPKHTAVLKPVHFETMQEVSVLPVLGTVYIKRKPSDAEARQFANLLPELTKLYGADVAAPYVTTPVFLDGQAELTGRDFVHQSVTVDGCLWLALSAAKSDLVTPTLALMAAPKLINIGVAPVVAAPLELEDVSVRRPIAMQWDIHSLDENGNSRFNRLTTDTDSTRGFTRTGVVRLQLPALGKHHAPTSNILRAGLGDMPPRLDDAAAAANVVAWIRLRPDPAAMLQSLSLSWLGINAVMIEQRESIPGRQTLGQGNGASDQQFGLNATSVDLAVLKIDVTDEQGTPRPWRRVDDTASAGRDEPVFGVDAEAGVVRFGDGVRGRAPRVGSLVQAYDVRSGGGSAGNLGAGSIKDIAVPDLKANQPLPTLGGAEAETLAEAEQRIPQSIRNQSRAVTELDFRHLALQTPGLAIGRVELLPRFKPHQKRSGVPGVVSVMCLPRIEGFDAPAPRPDRSTLESVHSWLDVRRPLATELYVIGCEYVPLALSVAVDLVDPDRRQTVLNNVKLALQKWLWALAPGGPNGQGWPLGRAVNDRELEVVVARVEGVDGVAPVLLYHKKKGKTAWEEVMRDQHQRTLLSLDPWQLPELLDVVVIEGQEADPSAIINGANNSGSGSSSTGVAIPVVPEFC